MISKKSAHSLWLGSQWGICIFIGCLAATGGFLAMGYMVPYRTFGESVPVLMFEVAYQGIALLIMYLAMKYAEMKYNFKYEEIA